MKKEVLKLEYQDVFDRVAVRIIYQNEEVLKRGNFFDKKLNVFSTNVSPQFYNQSLYIRGTNDVFDNDCFLVSKEEADIIKNKVKAINKKYVRWRAKKGGYYYLIRTSNAGGHLSVAVDRDNYSNFNNGVYEDGNYFKTHRQTELAIERIRNTLKQFQEELQGENNE